MRKKEYEVGEEIGSNGITFIKELEVSVSPKGYRDRTMLAKCHCGKEFKTYIGNVKKNHAKSCGCGMGTHKLSKHRLYATWSCMRERCSSDKHPNYHRYGGRGIRICEEWKDDVSKFIEDMYPSFKEGLTLDRIDNEKGYSKENCRWVTRGENNRNQSVRGKIPFRGVHMAGKQIVASVRVSPDSRGVKHIGSFSTIEEAALAYDKYVKDNNLPNRLNFED